MKIVIWDEENEYPTVISGCMTHCALIKIHPWETFSDRQGRD